MNYRKQWEVPSSDGMRTYTVSVTVGGEWSCSCVGWTRHYPRQDCKHIKGKKAGATWLSQTLRPTTRVSPIPDSDPSPRFDSGSMAVRTQSDVHRERREAYQAKKDAALGKLRYGFQLAHGYEPERDRLGPGWVAEVKYDGILGMAVDGRLINRSGRDITKRFPEIRVPLDAVLVGEIVILNTAGLSQFTLIQERATDNKYDIEVLSREHPAVFVAFDILEYGGEDVTRLAFEDRRQYLESYFYQHTDLVREKGFRLIEQLPVASDAQVQALVSKMRELGGEGFMLKNPNAPWVATRNRGFVKAKTWQEREFDILRHEWTGVGDGFVVWVSNRGYEQRVAMNDRRMREEVVAGRAKRVEVKFLSESVEGAMRFPTTLRLADMREDA